VLPLTAVVLTEYEVELPAATDAEAGDTAMVKSGGVCELMVIETVAECVADGAVPVIVRVYVPAAAVPELTVSVELPPAVTTPGLKPALAPAGTPEMLNVIDSALPLSTVVVTVYAAEPPDTTDADAGDAAMPKSEVGGCVTVTDTDVEWLPDAAVPVTVNT
jgi:hypothetical protein